MARQSNAPEVVAERPPRVRPIAPHSAEAEESLLGAMLMSHDALGAATDGLIPEDLFVPLNARLFRAMARMVEVGIPVDPVTLHEWLRANDPDPPIARPFLLDLQAATPASVNHRAYARTIREHAARRKLLDVAFRGAAMAKDLSVSPTDTIVKLHEMLDAADLPTGEGEPPPNIAQFLTQSSEFEWAWPGILEVMDRLILVAGEGHGKTTLMRQIAVCLSQGQDPFTFAPIPHCGVLVIDLENPGPLMRRKLGAMFDACNSLPRPAVVDTLRVEGRPGGLDLGNRSDVLWLQEQVATTRAWWDANGWHDLPFVLVIGPLYQMLGDELDAKEVRRLQRLLDRIRSRYRCAIIMETHAPHESFAAKAPPRSLRPAGPRQWIRWPEFCMAFEESDAVASTAERPLWDFYPVQGKVRDERDWPTRLIRRGGPLGWIKDPGY